MGSDDTEAATVGKRTSSQEKAEKEPGLQEPQDVVLRAGNQITPRYTTPSLKREGWSGGKIQTLDSFSHCHLFPPQCVCQVFDIAVTFVPLPACQHLNPKHVL